MSRIFIPIESVTIAHVARPLQIAKVLRRQGVEVIFGINDRFRSIIEEAGFEWRPIYCEDSKVLLDAVRNIDFQKQVRVLPKYLKADIEALQSAGKIDAVLGDFRFTLRLAAEHLGIPHIAIVNGYCSPYYAITPAMPGLLARHLPKFINRNLWIRKTLKELMFKFHAKPYQKLCRENQIKTDIQSGFDIAVSKTLTLICDLPEFTPQHELPSHYKFVGPILWEPEQAPDPLMESFLKTEKPLIYLTLGTSGDDALIHRLIEIFKHSRYDVVISTGSRHFSELPDNIYALPFVQASQILKKASLMICHGGNGSIYQALQHRVPIMAITTFYDQEWNGQRIEELGLGKSFYYKDVPYDDLLNHIHEMILDPQVKARLSHFEKLIGASGGSEQAAQYILDSIRESKKDQVAA